MYFDANLEVIRIQLQNHFAERKQRNRSYSLRGFARDLSMDPSLLSKVIRGTQRVSLSMYEQIADRLALSPIEMENDGGTQLADFQVLESDKFSLISDWYHYALIELTRTRDFTSDPAWIAKRLGLSVTEIKIALERLVRLKLIKVLEDGTIQDTAGNNSTGVPKNSSVAFRKLQRQLLEQAIDHLDKTPVEKRDNSSITVAISTKDLPKLSKCIDRFRKEFAKIAENNPEANEVYNLSISLFSCTKRSE